jgi:hypothetical protein
MVRPEVSTSPACRSRARISLTRCGAFCLT